MLQLVFAAAFHKLDGKRVLFPQGFHCTGMPIKVHMGSLTCSTLQVVFMWCACMLRTHASSTTSLRSPQTECCTIMGS